MNLAGDLIATCGHDKRIIIWSIKYWKAIKVIEAHKGDIYQVEFSPDSDYLYTCSADGLVNCWEWRTGEFL